MEIYEATKHLENHNIEKSDHKSEVDDLDVRFLGDHVTLYIKYLSSLLRHILSCYPTFNSILIGFRKTVSAYLSLWWKLLLVF